MFGLLGLMGAVLAGLFVDAMVAPNHGDHPQDDASDPDAEATHPYLHAGEAGIGSLLDDPGADNTPEAGLPKSDDLAAPEVASETLDGGQTNDILSGQDGNDAISGHEGNDLLGGRGGDDLIHGGDGVDWIHGEDGADTLSGGQGADDLQGEAGNDVLAGGGGNDTLSGGGGDDHLTGGVGDDSLIAGEGDDHLDGGSGADAAQGGYGNDVVIGGDDADTLDGNDGNDTLWQGWEDHSDQAVDFLNGGAGNDVLHIGAGDYANGGEGADQFALHDIKAGDPVAQITDFNRHEDSLVLLYDANLHGAPEVSVTTDPESPDAMVLLDGVPVAHVLGGAGLQPSDVTLQAA